MSVAKDFTMSDETWNKLKYQIKIGSFHERIGAYVVLSPLVFISILLFFIALFQILERVIDVKLSSEYNSFLGLLFWAIILFLNIYTYVFIEKRVRADRIKKGLPIKDNIVELLKQRAIDERVAMEVKAHEKVSPSKDLNYYFELLQKGAITQEEYDAKKAEFLK
jgi:uncharacterized membrane protein